jgi:lysophospholipid acyltransferase (LPLAT)-like uncharacterized protein
MSERFPTVYSRAGLTGYTLKQRTLIRIADLSFFVLIKLIGMTLRYEVVGEENRKSIAASGKLPIYALWHDRIFAGTYFLRDLGVVVLTSKSFDGEYIARFLTRFGFGSVRGSSSRGGVRGLVEMIRLMKQGLPMAFTVDGPRGPRYEAKSGPVMLAKKTGNPILPFLVESKSFWTVKSWDRLQIPKPFSRTCVFFSEPIYVDTDANDRAIESKRLELQTALDHIVKKGLDWGKS